MPKQANYSKFFRSYLMQDVPDNCEGNIVLDCPFGEDVGGDCQNPEEHLYADCSTGLWHCHRCDSSGNARTLITKLHQQWLEQTEPSHYAMLQRFRGIKADIFSSAQFAYDSSHDRWLVPYFTYDPETQQFTEFLNNLGTFSPSRSKDPFTIYKGGALATYLYNPGLHSYPNESGRCIITEGEWDTLAYYDAHPETEDLVLGKPGSGFPVAALEVTNGCNEFHLLNDNDNPGKKQQANMIRIIKDKRPKANIFILDWSIYPKDLSLSNGKKIKDIRDIWTSKSHRADIKQDIAASMVKYDALDSSSEVAAEAKALDRESHVGYVRDAEQFPMIKSFNEYIGLCKRYLFLPNETIKAMAATHSITTSIRIEGEPIYAFLIGPPSSGKTIHIESFGGQNQWFDNLSRLTAESFVSGWREDSGEDASYLPQLVGKTLFVKDFTVTLQGPIEAQKKLFGLITDVFDGYVRIPFGNNQIKEYSGLNFNMIAGVTDIVHAHSAASIGERFLRIEWLGNDFDRREFTRRAIQNMGMTNDMKMKLTEATLGFTKYLRELPLDPRVPERYIDPITDLAEFIAIVRTKVEHDRYEGILYRPRPELGPRVGKQLSKLFAAARAVMNSEEEAFDVVRKIGFDTCHSFAFDIVKYVFNNPQATRECMQRDLNIPSTTRIHKVVNDLCTTKVLTRHLQTSSGRGRPREFYKISPMLLPALDPKRYILNGPPTTQNRYPPKRLGETSSSSSVFTRRMPPPRSRA